MGGFLRSLDIWTPELDGEFVVYFELGDLGTLDLGIFMPFGGVGAGGAVKPDELNKAAGAAA